jgi:hypothetical protein
MLGKFYQRSPGLPWKQTLQPLRQALIRKESRYQSIDDTIVRLFISQASVSITRLERTIRNWQTVTIAASARLANRLTVAQDRGSDRPFVQAFAGSSREGFAARRAG